MAKIKRFTDFVNERREQLTLPFKEKEFEGKSVHEHLEDALIDLKAGEVKDYYSKSNPEAEIKPHYDKVLDELLDSDDIQVIEHICRMVSEYDPLDEDNEHYYKPEAVKEIKAQSEEDGFDNYEWDVATFIHENFGNLKKYVFTDDGWDEFKDKSSDQFSEDVYDMESAVQDAYDADENGLIDCWRTVMYNAGDEKDIYLNIMKHKGVGVYWAWDEDKAEAYWGESGGHSITLHGKVSVENVDWYQTLYRSAYGLREESEIRVKNDGVIMIVGFHDDVINKFHEFDEPFVVKVGRD